MWRTYMCRHRIFISSRVLISKTRPNPVTRKHNALLRCFLLRCLWWKTITLISVWICVGAHAIAPLWRPEHNLWELVLSSHGVDPGSQTQVLSLGGKCLLPTNPSCQSLRWGSVRTLQPDNHQTAVCSALCCWTSLPTLSLTLPLELRIQMAHLWWTQQFAVNQRLDKELAGPPQEEHLENRVMDEANCLCALSWIEEH